MTLLTDVDGFLLNLFVDRSYSRSFIHLTRRGPWFAAYFLPQDGLDPVDCSVHMKWKGMQLHTHHEGSIFRDRVQNRQLKLAVYNLNIFLFSYIDLVFYNLCPTIVSNTPYHVSYLKSKGNRGKTANNAGKKHRKGVCYCYSRFQKWSPLALGSCLFSLAHPL